MENIKIRNWINGKKVMGSGDTHKLYAPRNGRLIGEVIFSTEKDLDNAISMGQSAQKEWSSYTFKKRSEIIYKFRTSIEAARDELIGAIILENGKTASEADAEVSKAIELCEFATSIPSLVSGRVQTVSTGIEVREYNQPVGIVASITPFNFPLMVPMWTIPTVLGSGNVMILKPSEKTPNTALILARLLKESGLPDGVFNVLNGGRDIVEAICDHSKIDTVTFVGSTPVAEIVYKRSTSNLKRCLALGGAKNHIIVTEEVDQKVAAREILSAAFGMSGQRCMAASTVLTVGSSTRLINELIAQSGDYVPGDTMGPLITRESVDIIRKFIKESKGTVLVDGRDTVINGDTNGYYIGGSIIKYEKYEDMPVEEIFGPTLEVVECETLEEAIEMQNLSPYANGATIFTDLGENAYKAIEGFSSGMIGVNIGVPVPRDPFSFGGLKMSKFGVGDITGYNSLPLFMKTKKVTTKWNPQFKKDWMS